MLTAEIVLAHPDGLVLRGAFDDASDLPGLPARIHLERAQAFLISKGLEVLVVGPWSISVRGTVAQYSEIFGCRFTQESIKAGKPVFANDDPSLHPLSGSFLNDFEAVVIVSGDIRHSVHQILAPDACPLPKPYVDYYHLNAPEDLRSALNAQSAYAANIRGEGVNVVVVDSGFWNHPWFQDRGLHVDVVLAPGASAPDLDEVGHGTMVCASLLSIAPAAQVTLIKQYNDDAFTAFKIAVARSPDIIQNTWGNIVETPPLSAADRLVAVTVLEAISRGIVVVFAGGNGKKLFPQQLRQVISVGGTYVCPDHSLEAASYASGYASDLVTGRCVPDFCGVVGLKPEGVLLMMPTMPGSEIDVAFAEKPYPDGDGTGLPDDGWVVISGTSSGSAQVSGAIALLKQIRPEMHQGAVKRLLSRSCEPVLVGQSSEGNPAGEPIPNLATGYGLVNVQRAIAELNAAP